MSRYSRFANLFRFLEPGIPWSHASSAFTLGKTFSSIGLRYILLYFFILGWTLSVYSQAAVVKGRVVDENREPLTGANVYLQGTILGSATNSEGRFIIEKVPHGSFLLVISMIGYRQKEMELSIQESRVYDVGTVQLVISPLITEPVVVTASKYRQKVQDVPVSLSTLTRSDFSYRNTITLDDALQYISGINLNASQVNIRGSSGYSRGVGSRVLLLMDGIPFLTGDTREINFSAIPVDLIQRVEVMKGAGSALYGSSALGGVINVITKDVRDLPPVYCRLYTGFYDEPFYDEWKWSDKTRFFNGQSVNVAHHRGNFAFVLGGNRDQDDSYKQNDWHRRYTVSGKVQWAVSPYQQLTVSGNLMRQKRGNFLYWKSLTNALTPLEDQLDDWVKTNRLYLNASYRHILQRNRYLTVRGIWFRNHFEDNVSAGGGNISTSNYFDGEVQFNLKRGRHFLTTGIEGSRSAVTSNIFGDRTSMGGALYIQDEISWSPDWTTTLGARLDLVHTDSVGTDWRINPKLGVVYQPRMGTAIRASLGSGFRAPSLAEVFTSTTAAGLHVIPNPDLRPERSLSAELGWNQFFSDWLIGDLAVFFNRFWDLIEGTFIPGGDIQFRNITRARIWGAETSLSGSLLRRRLHFTLGYTFVEPRDLSADKFLKYRPRHLLYATGKWNLARLQVGVDYRFISRYDEIDRTFALIVKDGEQRVAAHVLDLRLALNFRLFNSAGRASLQINNLLQYNYVDLVGSIAPIRNFVFSLEVGL